MFKLAFSTLGCPDYTVDQVIETANRLGYDGVGIRTIAGSTDLPSMEEFSPRGIGATARKFRAARLAVVCVSSGVRFTSSDADERTAQLETSRRYVDMAVALDAPFIRIFGGPIKPDMDREATMERIVEGFRAVGTYARSRGVTALLETHDTFSTGKSVRELLDRVDETGIGVVWDILHSYRFGESFAETWRLIGDRVGNVHIKDSARFDDSSFDIRLCGEGNVPVPDAVSLLVENGYDGFYEFEWEKGWHPEIPEADTAFPHYVDYMKRLAGEIGVRG